MSKPNFEIRSAPMMGCGTSAIVNIHLIGLRKPKSSVISLSPKVSITDSFAGKSLNFAGESALLAKNFERMEMSAPESIRRRNPLSLTMRRFCTGSSPLTVSARGKNISFPTFCQMVASRSMVGYISGHLCQIYDDKNKVYQCSDDCFPNASVNEICCDF